MTQKEKVLKYLQTGKGLTPLQAMNWWGVMRLGSRVFELREDGHNVVSQMKSVKNREGKKCYVAEYRLKGAKGGK